MRFIDTKSLRFQEVADSDLRELENGYCILSHRWGDEEVLYNDVLLSGREIETKTGYAKFAGACAKARALGFSFIWIDTCCINKIDSVELGEAINSMYRWYQDSRICIAYLEDIKSTDVIASSQWFDRGWTLQELIAPGVVQFYDADWNLRGDKQGLSEQLSERTGIPTNVLRNERLPQDCSIAQRMSWASKRKTKRLEDQAYCLMGLFEVNMPMIYGEREKAFTRLQEQIITRSNDESIFAWKFEYGKNSNDIAFPKYWGLLSPSPAYFDGCNHIVPTGRSKGYKIDQTGLAIQMPSSWYGLDREYVQLNAIDSMSGRRCYIILAKTSQDDSYVRTISDTGDEIRLQMPSKFVHKKYNVILKPTRPPLNMYPGFWIRTMDTLDENLCRVRTMSVGKAAENDRLRLPGNGIQTAGVLQFTFQGLGSVYLKFGFDADNIPTCHKAFGVDSMANHFEAAMTNPSNLTRSTLSAIDQQKWYNATNLTQHQSDGLVYNPQSLSDKMLFTSKRIIFTCLVFEYNIKVELSRLTDLRPSTAHTQSNSQLWTLDVTVRNPTGGSNDSISSSSTWCC